MPRVAIPFRANRLAPMSMMLDPSMLSMGLFPPRIKLKTMMVTMTKARTLGICNLERSTFFFKMLHKEDTHQVLYDAGGQNGCGIGNLRVKKVVIEIG